MSSDHLLTRALLIGGFIVFVAGASGLVLGQWVVMSYEEGLQWTAAHPKSWMASNALLAASVVLMAAGLGVFNEYFPGGGVRMLAHFGFVTFFVGAVCWVLAMALRLSVEPWAAQFLVEARPMPASATALRGLESVLHAAFMYCALTASSIYGLALLGSPRFGNAAGWFAVAYGSIIAIWEALNAGPIPGMALIVPLVLGLLPLPELPEAGQAGKRRG